MGISQSSNLAHAESALEPAVNRIARALAVVPSLGPTAKAWKRLGFALSDPFDYHGCVAQDVVLGGAGLRFLAPAPEPSSTQLAAAVADRLTAGAGLLGWSWACYSVARAIGTIEECSGVSFDDDGEGPRAVIVPRKLTPGAITLIEPSMREHAPIHRNGVVSIDQIVVTVNDAARATAVYETSFRLNATRSEMEGSVYGFLTVGGTHAPVLELVGPARPEKGGLVGHTWGLTFRTPDIDATVAAMRAAQVVISAPRPAVQGGRMTSFPMQLGGIHVAFIGE